MNIFENIQPSTLRLRPYLTKEEYKQSTNDIVVKVHRLLGVDAKSAFINRYEIGYDIEFYLTTCRDLTELIERNVLIAVFDDQDKLQIGDESGFRIAGVLPPPTISMPYYVYTFKTDRPNKTQFKSLVK